MTQMNMTESMQDSQEEKIFVIPEQTLESTTSGQTRFDVLDLPQEIMAATKELGFDFCTPIQEAVINGAIKAPRLILM